MTAGPAPLALSMGEPAGVGPEIIAGAWAALKGEGPVFCVIGDAALMRAQGRPVETVTSPSAAGEVFGRAIPVLDNPLPARVTPGRPEPANAGAVADWIEQAVSLALSGEVSGVVTAPIAKAPLYAAGFRFPGHTEFIAELTADAPFTGTRGPVMMLTARDLRACLVTIHTPLAEVPGLVTAERVRRTARVVHEAMKRDFGIAAPRLALAALNPHAGESGLIGREEIEVLAPAVAALRAEGIDISDPRPADTLFHDAARATYDAVLCLYHDQAL
ncbi:MAG: 4-hydroxythreonine-4-phosphate dehydrogenase PdxA, partial [Brevundimonas sp.]